MADSIDLAAIKARADAATEGPWEFGTAPHPDSNETKAEYVANASCGDGPLWVAWAPNLTDDGYAYLVTGITGDGPTSEANATFIAHAREDVPKLVAEVKQLRAELTEVHAVAVEFLPDAIGLNTLPEIMAGIARQRDFQHEVKDHLAETAGKLTAERDASLAEVERLRAVVLQLQGAIAWMSAHD
jgi:hypothetical protein